MGGTALPLELDRNFKERILHAANPECPSGLPCHGAQAVKATGRSGKHTWSECSELLVQEGLNLSKGLFWDKGEALFVYYVTRV